MATNKNFKVNNGLDVSGPISTTSNTLITNLNADLLDGQHGSYYAPLTSLSSHTANTSNPHGVTATQVGLGNVTNESKTTMFSSPTFTGIPVAPTASSGTNTTQLATTAYVSTAIANLVETAPTTLDTLNELAAALGDDPNFSNTIVTLIGTKVDKINITGATKGSSTKIPIITYNAQGQITSASESDITVGDGLITIQGSNGLSGSGSFTLNQGTNATVTLNHSDTSSQESVNNSGRTYIQDITLDAYGHVTSLSSATETVVDTNTTYTINAGDVTTNEYKINLAGSDSTNDYISLKGGTNVTLTRNVDQIIISSSDTNTTYSAGSGLTLTGTAFSHTDTSSQASLTALTGANVVSDIDLDTYGHVTLLATRTMTLADLGYTGATNANYYTLPVATSSILGGVTSGTDITIDASGNVSVNDDSHNHVISNVDGLQTALDAKAPLASPTFTGTVSLPSTTTLNSVVIADATNYFQKPNGVSSPLFSKVSAASISIPIGFKCLVNNVIVSVTSLVTLTLNSTGVNGLDTGTKTAGTDYYVYALNTGNFIISANASYPTDYTANNSRKIGGFHYGVIPESFTAINNITSTDATAIAGINTYSFWDLKYRFAGGDNRGMHKMGNRWYDIYLLNSEHIINGTSKAGAIIAAGGTDYSRAYPKIPLAFGGNGTTNYGSFTWFEAAEIANAYGKDLISYKEFVSLAYGVLEASSSGDSDATIKHIANFTSKWGTCQVTGHEWIWGSDVQGIGSDGWKTGLTENRGSLYAYANQPTAVVLGGGWDAGSISGSRSSSWSSSVWVSYWFIGALFSGDHLELA